MDVAPIAGDHARVWVGHSYFHGVVVHTRNVTATRRQRSASSAGAGCADVTGMQAVQRNQATDNKVQAGPGLGLRRRRRGPSAAPASASRRRSSCRPRR
jgi:hypothetical protein